MAYQRESGPKHRAWAQRRGLVEMPAGLVQAVTNAALFGRSERESPAAYVRRWHACINLLGASCRFGPRSSGKVVWCPAPVADAFEAVLDFCPALRSGAYTAALRAAIDPDYPAAVRAAHALGGGDAVRVLLEPTPEEV